LTAGLILPGRLIILGSLFLSIIVVYINRGNRRNFKAAIILVVFLGGMQNYSLAFNTEDRLTALNSETAVYECLIMDKPVVKGSYLQYTAKSLLVVHEGKYYNFNEKVFLKTTSKHVYNFGDRVKAEGTCSDITGVRNPGDFNYRLYYKSKGISKVLNAESMELLKADNAGILSTMQYHSKEKVIDTINGALPVETAAILVGIITGDKADIDEDTRDAYMKTGLSHILSVSGLHVGFLMLLVTYALMPFRLDKRLQGFIIILTVTYYILLIGAPLPAVRALIMLGVLMAGKALGRNYDLLSSVSFAALVIMLFRPLAIHDPGCMISFGAMYSIAIIYPVIYSLLRKTPNNKYNCSSYFLSGNNSRFCRSNCWNGIEDSCDIHIFCGSLSNKPSQLYNPKGGGASFCRLSYSYTSSLYLSLILLRYSTIACIFQKSLFQDIYYQIRIGLFDHCCGYPFNLQHAFKRS
jgi:competence protein ComEC